MEYRIEITEDWILDPTPDSCWHTKTDGFRVATAHRHTEGDSWIWSSDREFGSYAAAHKYAHQLREKLTQAGHSILVFTA